MLLQASAGGQLLNTSDVHVVAVASAIEPALCPSKLPGTRYQQFHKLAAISVGITAGLQTIRYPRHCSYHKQSAGSIVGLTGITNTWQILGRGWPRSRSCSDEGETISNSVTLNVLAGHFSKLVRRLMGAIFEFQVPLWSG